MDAHGMPVRMFITAGPVADCSKACRLIEGIDAEYLLADKGYASDALVETLRQAGVKPAIPLVKVENICVQAINIFIDFAPY